MPVGYDEDDLRWEELLSRCQLDRGPMPVTVKVVRRHPGDYGTRLHTVAVTVDRETGKRATVERIDPVGPWRGEQAAIQDLRVWQHEATAASHADEAVELLDGLDPNESSILKGLLAERAKRS